jgi:tetratricopeptide (TPR) repeat protein
MQNQPVSKSTFSEIIELINQGQVSRAAGICREAVDANPDDVNMLGLLGAILVKTRNYKEAEKYLRRTIDLAPTFAKPYEDLGHTLISLKRYEEAIEVLENATRLDPGLELAFFNLGKALAATGRGKEADSAFEKAFSLSPERKALAQAAEWISDGKYDEAEKICRRVLQKAPNNVDAMRLLAQLATRLQRTADAERYLRKTIEIAPDFTGAIADLGSLLEEDDRYEEAIACFEKAIELEPDNPIFYDRLGYILAPAAQTYAAIDAHRKAIELNPNFAASWLGLGHTLKTVGQQNEAIEAYRKCISLRPDYGVTYWSLANLKTYRFSDEDIAEMESRISSDKVTGESEINFHFSLAKAYEDRKDYANAWHHYKEGNSKRRMQETYDPVDTEVFNDRIITVFNRELLEGNTGLGNPDPSPIFIVGLPRSGSTLIEQILASHSSVEGTSELPYMFRVSKSLNRNRANGINFPEAVGELGEKHLKAMGQDYIDSCRMHRTEGRPHFIDKNPNNFTNIGFIHMVLPNAKIIDARRHPMDACFSCYRQLFAKGQPFTYDLTDIGEYYLQYQRMMDHWHDVLPGRVLTVQYEEVVSDFENQVRRLLDYCELPWEDSCLRYYDTDRPIRTASSEQVRQPIYTESLHRWRNYEQYLDELKTTLEPIMEHYNKYLDVAQRPS